MLKSSFVLSEEDDDESPGFIWLSGIFVLDEDDSDVTKTLSSELKSSCQKSKQFTFADSYLHSPLK